MYAQRNIANYNRVQKAEIIAIEMMRKGKMIVS